MASEIRVNTINNRSGLGTITISDTGAVFAGVTTITSLQVTGTLIGVANTDNIRTNTNATFLQNVNVSGAVTSTGMIVTGVTTVAAGSTSVPSISPSGDTNTGIFFPSADTIAFGEGGAESARIDSSGRFGIGTNSVNTTLEVLNSSTPIIRVGDGTRHMELRGGSTTQNAAVGTNYNGSIDIIQNGTPAASIDTSKRLLVGTTSARTIEPYGLGTDGQIANTFESVGDTNPGPGLSLCSNSTTARMGPYLYFCRSNAGSIGSNTLVNSGDNLGTISFAGADGTDVRTRGAAIYCEVDGTPGTNDMPGRLIFSTTADGAAIPTERMRIASDGSATFYYGQRWADRGTSKGVVTPDFRLYNTTSNTFVIDNYTVGVQLVGGATAWTTFSDERQKTNLQPIENGLSKISTLRAVTGRYLVDAEDVSRSFLIAQDVQAVLPEAVSVDSDEDGTLGLRYTEVIPLLVAALKEGKERIETLETEKTTQQALINDLITRVAALEAQ